MCIFHAADSTLFKPVTSFPCNMMYEPADDGFTLSWWYDAVQDHKLAAEDLAQDRVESYAWHPLPRSGEVQSPESGWVPTPRLDESMKCRARRRARRLRVPLTLEALLDDVPTTCRTVQHHMYWKVRPAVEQTGHHPSRGTPRKDGWRAQATYDIPVRTQGGRKEARDL